MVAWIIDWLLVTVVYVFLVQAPPITDATYVRDTSCDTIEQRSGTEFAACFELGEWRTYLIEDGSRLALAWLSSLVLSFLYLAVLQGVTGTTLGKQLAGIRTVQEDGRPPGIAKATLRWVLLIVDAFPYLAPLVGFICSLTSAGHRRVGDMAAKTFVVHRAAAGQPIVVPGVTTGATAYPPGGWAAPAGPSWGTPPGEPPSGGWGAPSEPAPGPWGTPAEPTDTTSPGWASPTSAEPIEPSTPPAATPAPSSDGPQWDEARGTYIQWDPNQGKWLQWDEAGRAWQVIPGQ